MLEAIVVKISKVEKCKDGYYYSLQYKTYGQIKEVEYFSEYGGLCVGDKIYI